MAKRTPKRKHRTVALKGLTPSEIEAWRAQEIRERAKDRKKADAEARERGKPGRPKGKKRLYREATRDTRTAEVRAQRDERKRRAGRGGARSGAYSRIAALEPERRKTTRSGVEKTFYRVRGAGAWQEVVDALNRLPRGSSAYVQVGAGYGAKAPWVGSRLTEPAQAAGWLEGIGLKYQQKIFKGRKPDELFIEFVAYRKVKDRGEKGTGKKAVAAQRRGKSGAAKSARANAKASAKAGRVTRGKSGTGSARRFTAREDDGDESED